MVNRYLAVYREIFLTPSAQRAWWIYSPLIITFVFSTRPWTTLSTCATVCRTSSRVNLSSLWTISFTFFSPTSFLTSFSTFLSQVMNSLTGDGLTKVSLLCHFGSQRECGEQLHKYLDNHLIHGFCGRDLGIDLEAIEEVSN